MGALSLEAIRYHYPHLGSVPWQQIHRFRWASVAEQRSLKRGTGGTGNFRDPEFPRRRFERLGDVFETKLLRQQLVFIRGERAMTDLLGSSDATEGSWPRSVRQLLGSRSLANRNGADHRARRWVAG